MDSKAVRSRQQSIEADDDPSTPGEHSGAEDNAWPYRDGVFSIVSGTTNLEGTDSLEQLRGSAPDPGPIMNVRPLCPTHSTYPDFLGLQSSR